MFQNVQSLRKQFEEIKCNKEYQSADVLLFCETWLDDQGTSNDNFNIEGFKKTKIIQGWNTHRGLITYSKQKTNNTHDFVCANFEIAKMTFGVWLSGYGGFHFLTHMSAPLFVVAKTPGAFIFLSVHQSLLST